MLLPTLLSSFAREFRSRTNQEAAAYDELRLFSFLGLLTMPRFVVLWHKAGPALDRASHFDLLFEDGESARTWSVENQIESGIDQVAIELPRHRLHYFEYEGPLSNDRGSVSRRDQGNYQLLRATDDQFQIEIDGKQLQGKLRFTRIDRERWNLRFEAMT